MSHGLYNVARKHTTCVLSTTNIIQLDIGVDDSLSTMVVQKIDEAFQVRPQSFRLL